MARNRARGRWKISLAIFIIAASATLLLQRHNEGTISGAARVIDGDTLIIAGQTVRLWGIDAPEWDQICGDNEWPCGQHASDHLRALVRGKSLTCTTFGRDIYRRLLATCRTAPVDGVNIAASLVANGYAVASDDYFALEKGARQAGKNLWSGPFERPAQWRRQQKS